MKKILLLISLVISIMLVGCKSKPTPGLTVATKNGVKHGEAIYRDRNGNIKSRSQYVNGKLEGKSYSYYRGQVSWENNYVNGKLEGVTTRYKSTI